MLLCTSTCPMLPCTSAYPVLLCISTYPMLLCISTYPMLLCISAYPLLPCTSTYPMLPCTSTYPLLHWWLTSWTKGPYATLLTVNTAVCLPTISGWSDSSSSLITFLFRKVFIHYTYICETGRRMRPSLTFYAWRKVPEANQIIKCCICFCYSFKLGDGIKWNYRLFHSFRFCFYFIVVTWLG